MTSRDGKSQRREGKRREERRSKKRKSQKKEDPGAQKGRKVAKHCVFPMICGSGGSKSRLKRRVQSQLAKWEMKNCTPLWREAHFQIKMYKSAFRSCDVEKVHAVREAHFEVKSVKKLKVSEHFWKLRCRKSAGRCGAKQISKSKVQETEGYGARSDVVLCGSRKGLCTFSKMSKTCGFCSISEKSENALVRGLELCTQLSIFEGSLAGLFRFWCCHRRKMRKSRRIPSFLHLSTSKIEEAFRFWCCQVQKLRKSRRIAWLSSLQIAARYIDRQIDK